MAPRTAIIRPRLGRVDSTSGVEKSAMVTSMSVEAAMEMVSVASQ
jgi:hypothetical protein